MADELATPADGSCFWVHQWSKWTQYAVQGKTVLVDGNSYDCSMIKQKRVCLRCNKMEVGHVSG